MKGPSDLGGGGCHGRDELDQAGEEGFVHLLHNHGGGEVLASGVPRRRRRPPLRPPSAASQGVQAVDVDVYTAFF